MRHQSIVSIIICTCRRNDSLCQTLDTIGRLEIPNGTSAETLVIDNSSDADACRHFAEYVLPNMPIQFAHEPRKGQSFARNLGIEKSRGDIVIYTDDDMVLPPNWLKGMIKPIQEGHSDMVAGGIRMAPDLEREWMEPLHYIWLADTRNFASSNGKSSIAVGGNMAIARHVFDRVPKFDTNIGPGKLGFCDDLLFSYQAIAAGYTIAASFDVIAEHHFDPRRLTREAFIQRATAEGKSEAYIYHHWFHSHIRFSGIRQLKHQSELALLRLMNPTRGLNVPNAQQLQLIKEIAFHRFFRTINKSPRHYVKCIQCSVHQDQTEDSVGLCDSNI